VTVTKMVKHSVDNMMKVKDVQLLVLKMDIGWLVSMRIIYNAGVSIIQKMTSFAIPL
jgi:hypothetical protein